MAAAIDDASEHEASVVAAAKAWAAAIEAVAEASDRSDAKLKRDAADAALVAVYDAVLALRALQRQMTFTGLKGPKASRRSNVVRLIASATEG